MNHILTKSYNDQIRTLLLEATYLETMTKQVILCPVRSTDTWHLRALLFPVAPVGTQGHPRDRVMITTATVRTTLRTCQKNSLAPKTILLHSLNFTTLRLPGKRGAVCSPPLLHLFLLHVTAQFPPLASLTCPPGAATKESESQGSLQMRNNSFMAIPCKSPKTQTGARKNSTA